MTQPLDNVMDHAKLQAIIRGPHTTEDLVRSQADCVYSDSVTMTHCSHPRNFTTQVRVPTILLPAYVGILKTRSYSSYGHNVIVRVNGNQFERKLKLGFNHSLTHSLTLHV